MAKTTTPTAIPMVDLQTQYSRLRPEIDQAIQEVLESTQFINGAPVGSFAENLAAYLGVRHVIPCANGTDALQIALMALDLQPGDEVITTPFTFVATAEVIALLHLQPVFVDVDPDTFLMDTAQLESVVSERTRCILPVHLFGQGVDMTAVMAFAEKHGLYVVEDNAQSIGATGFMSGGRQARLGAIGHIGCTSFFPSKNLGAYGDAGALFTNDDEFGRRIQMIVNHGMKRRYYHDMIGVNSRLDTLQATVLDIKLRHLDDFNRRRQAAAAYYDERLAEQAGLQTPHRTPHSDHVFHQYTLRLFEGRDEIKARLDEVGVASAIYYPVPLHLQQAYRSYGFQEGQFPVTERLSEEVLSLPMHSELNPEIQDEIIYQLKKALQA